MSEIIYEKKYPQLRAEEIEALLSPVDAALPPDYMPPSFDQFSSRLARRVYVPITERLRSADEFIRTAQQVAELYQLDITITRHRAHISVDLCFDAAGGLLHLKDGIRFADDISFFVNSSGHEITLSLDHYTHSVFCREPLFRL